MTTIRTDIWATSYSNDKEKREHFRTQLCKVNESRIWILNKLLELKSIKSVLDLGCSFGLDVEHLEKMTEKIPFKYIGVDFTPAFIEVAREHFPEYNFVVANAMDLPYKDKSFDVVYTRHTLEHVSDPFKEIDEMFRVSKKYVIIGWFRLVDSETVYQTKSNKYGEYPLHDLNREEFTNYVLEKGEILDSYTIANHECWLIKKKSKKGSKK